MTRVNKIVLGLMVLGATSTCLAISYMAVSTKTPTSTQKTARVTTTASATKPQTPAAGKGKN